MPTAKTQERAPYLVPRQEQAANDDAIIAEAIKILNTRLREPGAVLSSPDKVRAYLRLLMQELEHEVFYCLMLDAQNRLIEAQQLFRGTLTQTAVYPREVVKAALACNAGAVIFAHNHPSSLAESSRADELLTQSLKQALALVDVKVLDHFIVGGGTILSFAERGLL